MNEHHKAILYNVTNYKKISLGFIIMVEITIKVNHASATRLTPTYSLASSKYKRSEISPMLNYRYILLLYV